MEEVRTTTLAERIAELTERHGSLRAASRVIGVDASYLSRLASGEKEHPLKPILDKLGLRQVVSYKRKRPTL